MSRKQRYKQAKFWRGFIAKALGIKNEDDLRHHLASLSCVQMVMVEHGWTTWVTVELNDGKTLIERGVFGYDTILQMCHSLYKYSRDQYLKYINAKTEKK